MSHFIDYDDIIATLIYIVAWWLENLARDLIHMSQQVMTEVLVSEVSSA